MDSAKNQLVDRLKSANNILVTVSRNPSVDQLSALLGLTLLLNKYDKHAAAVFSGEVPSTIEFLKPEETFEKNTDSLRDFIIALDKSKADKLRYKVEDDVVRIFITPYRTSISEADLDFSQGDFNVDVVVALGVTKQEDLDEAITTHGRILHDATVTSMTLTAEQGLGSINWQDPQASSLSELVTELGQALDPTLLDNQISTALLTGIVAETDRFSNQKTTSHTMSASAALMAAGADQQLVAAKLNEPAPAHKDEGDSDQSSKAADLPSDEPPKSDDGTIEIDHPKDAPSDEANEAEAPTATQEDKVDEAEEAVDEAFALPAPQDDEAPESHVEEQATDVETPAEAVSPGPKLVTEPPSLGGRLTANSEPEGLDPSIDPLGLSTEDAPRLLTRSDTPMSTSALQSTSDDPAASTETPQLTPPPTDWTPPQPEQPAVEAQPTPVVPEVALPAADTPEPQATPAAQEQTLPPPPPAPEAPEPPDSKAGQIHISEDGTLAELEASVNSPHLDSARDEVSKALNNGSTPETPKPIDALNAQPLGDSLHTPAAPSNDDVQPPSAAPLLDSVAPSAMPAPPSIIDNTPPAMPDGTPPTPVIPTADPAQSVMPADPIVQPTPSVTPAQAPQVVDPNAPPPVPPPIPFQFGTPSNSQDQK